MSDLINVLENFGVPKSESRKYQILCLPENIYSAEKKEELLDAGDSSSLSKELKALGVECGNSLDLGLKPRTRIRKSLDLWLGVVYIAQYVALPFLISAFANLVTSKALNSDSKVFLNLKIDKEYSTTAINYEGDAETLLKIFDALKEQ
jgi:hypothetical protein